LALKKQLLNEKTLNSNKRVGKNKGNISKKIAKNLMNFKLKFFF